MVEATEHPEKNRRQTRNAARRRRKVERPWVPEPSRDDLIEEDLVSALNYHAFHGHGLDRPEKRLMRAVLEQSLDDYRKGRQPGAPAELRVRADQEELWFMDNATWWPYSFVRICHALGINPEYIRRLVSGICRQNRADSHHKPRKRVS